MQTVVVIIVELHCGRKITQSLFKSTLNEFLRTILPLKLTIRGIFPDSPSTKVYTKQHEKSLEIHHSRCLRKYF